MCLIRFSILVVCVMLRVVVGLFSMMILGLSSSEWVIVIVWC